MTEQLHINTVPGVPVASVRVGDRAPGATREVVLDDAIRAFVDDEGIVELEVDDTGRFGTPFDDAAAARAVEWARAALR